MSDQANLVCGMPDRNSFMADEDDGQFVDQFGSEGLIKFGSPSVH